MGTQLDSGSMKVRKKGARGKVSSRAHGDDASVGGGDLNPVMVYLQRIGDVQLLNRLGEQRISQQIEEGTIQVFEALLGMRFGRDELLGASQRLLDDVTYRCQIMDTDDDVEFEDTGALKELEKFHQQLTQARETWERLSGGSFAPQGLDEDAETELRHAQRALFRLFKEFGFGYRVFVKVLSTVRQAAADVKRSQRQLARFGTMVGATPATLVEAYKRGGSAWPSMTESLKRRVEVAAGNIDRVERQMGTDIATFIDRAARLEQGHLRAEQGRAVMILANLRLVVSIAKRYMNRSL
ncbi:MAG: hypothetical protein KC635_16660, partial [Myxococcales bacterium]|nr:hypothetical protein [Myxococcales bacterium]